MNKKPSLLQEVKQLREVMQKKIEQIREDYEESDEDQNINPQIKSNPRTIHRIARTQF